MTDGTGREMLPGLEQKVVELDVAYADEYVIVATVNDPKNQLVLVREEDLDTKLAELRVS